MSRVFANAKLVGHAPSTRYQAELEALQDAMEDVVHGDMGFQSMFMAVPIPHNFWFSQGYSDIKTDDGYGWYCARMFVLEHGAFVLLFPWCGDREKKDGSTADRSIQIHFFGNVDYNHSQIRSVLEGLTELVLSLHHNHDVANGSR